jgi:hypothetical protein
MAEENIIFNTQINTGNSATSIKSVRAELRELQQQMAGMEVGSQSFVKAAQRAGELQDRMQDAQAAVKAFNPEMKFQAFAGVLGGVVNGLQAAQGAIAIFGDKSKDVEKIIAQTQGAIALASGVNGLLGMKDQFVILSNVIKTQVVTSFNTLGKAIKSTGIIALVASLGVLIYEWYQEKKAAEEATKANKKAQEQFEEFSEKIKDLQVEGMKGRQKEREEIKRNMNSQLKDIDEAVKKETYTIEQGEKLKNQIRSNARFALSEKEKAWAKEDREKKQKDQLKIADDLIALEKAKAIETEAQANNIYALELSRLKYQKEQKLITSNEYAAGEIKIQRELNDTIFNLDMQKLNNQKTIADASVGIVNNLSQAVGANAETMKAIAVAQTTIDTYFAAQIAFLQAKKNPITIANPAYPYIMAGAAIAAGLARVAAIVRVPARGNIGGGAPSGGGGAPSAPALPPPSSATRLTNGNEPIITRELNVKENRVYVLEKDITKKQDDVAGIVNKATIQ